MRGFFIYQVVMLTKWVKVQADITERKGYERRR